MPLCLKKSGQQLLKDGQHFSYAFHRRDEDVVRFDCDRKYLAKCPVSVVVKREALESATYNAWIQGEYAGAGTITGAGHRGPGNPGGDSIHNHAPAVCCRFLQ